MTQRSRGPWYLFNPLVAWLRRTTQAIQELR